MIRRIVAVSFSLVALAVASPARADSSSYSSFTIEGLAGWQSLRASADGLGSAISGREGTAIVGGDVLGRFDMLGLGVSLDKTVSGNGKPWAGSIMAGFLFDLLPSLRLEALGEIGRRATDFGDMFKSVGSTFVGFRPGVSVRLAVTPVRLGVSALVRWPTKGGDFNSPDYGLVGRVGIEFP